MTNVKKIKHKLGKMKEPQENYQTPLEEETQN